MRVALDSNVLLYSEGLDDLERQDAARSLIQRISRQSIVIPVQVLGELFNVGRRKLTLTAHDAERMVRRWVRLADATPDTTAESFDIALELARTHELQIWDAVILAAASAARCELLLSEDMQDGFVWRGVTVASPFVVTLHPLLADALRS